MLMAEYGGVYMDEKAILSDKERLAGRDVMLLQAVVSQLTECIAITSKDLYILACSPAFNTTFNLSAHSLPGTYISSLVGKDLSKIPDLASIKSGEIVMEEPVTLLVNGIPSDFLMCLRTLSHSPAEQLMYMFTFFPQPGLKKSEIDELKQVVSQLQLGIEAGKIGIWKWDVLTNELIWTKEQEALYGLAEGEFGKKLSDFHKFVHTEDFNRLTRDVENHLVATDLEYQFRITRKDGEQRWIQARSRNSFDAAGNLISVTGINIDITEQVNAKNKIQEAEERFRIALKGSGQIAFSQDETLRYTWIYSGDTGLDADKIIGKTDSELYDGATAERLTALKSFVLKTGEGLRSEVGMSKNGKLTYHNLLVEPLSDENGKVIGVTGVSNDITEQVAARKDIEEKEARMRLAASAGHMGTYEIDLRSDSIFYSKELAEIFGLDLQKKWRHDDFKTRIHVDDRQLRDAAYEESFKSGTVFYEARVVWDDGTIRWVRINAKVVFEGAQAVKLYGIAADITEEKKVVQRIKASEEKLRNLFEKMDQGFCIVEMIFDETSKPVDYRFLECNPVFGEQTGLYDAVGKTAKELVPDLEDRWPEVYGKVSLTGEPIRFVLGSEAMGRWFEVYSFRADTLDPRKVAILFTDITSKKKAEASIREKEERFRILAESLPQLIWVAGPHGEGEYTSLRWNEYCGADVVDQQTWTNMVHPDDLPAMMTSWNHSLQTGELYTAECRLKNKHGQYLWHVTEGIPLKNSEGKITRWVGAFTNIHEQKTKEQKKDEFISIASHEMKTPLTTAKAYLQLLEMSLEDKSDTFSIYVAKASSSIQRLHELISEMLDASKIQNGRVNYTITEFDFNEMIDGAVESIQYCTPSHSIIKIGQSSRRLKGDKNRLQQVVANLLTNAVKYSPDAREVIAELKETEESFVFKVVDRGIGIAKEHLDKIFDRYYRVAEHAIHFQGLGIGLYISHEIIKRHGGDIWAESEPGEGTTVYFSIPFTNNL